MVMERCYLQYGLSSRQVAQLRAELSITIDHITGSLWTQ
jgi:transposase-like protein